MMNVLENIQEEDRFALMVTGGFHVVLLLFCILYTFTLNSNVRPSFIEVQFGDFSSGKKAQFAEQKQKKVATSPTPSDVQPDKPKPEQPKPVEQKKVSSKETTKPVDAPDQKKEVKEKELKTPKTDKVKPKKNTSVKDKKDVVIPPKARQAKTRQQGAKNSGDKKGTQGDVEADQGTGNEEKKSAPFNLNIEGINRDPLVQPIPKNLAGNEATVTLRFEVTPNGEVTNIIPVRKSGNPNIDSEVIRTLSNWRFSRLPAGVPQQNQKGTVTFRFVVE